MKPVLAVLCTVLMTGVASANITITGTGKVKYTPDLAHVSVGVSSDAKTAADAWRQNAATVEKLFDVLKKYGIDPKDMNTAGVGVSPRYFYPKNEEPRLIGYTVTYDLAVTVRKLGDLGKVLDGMVENGANRSVGIRFGTANPEKLLDQAREAAAKDARKKAELYTKGAGAGLGHVVSISEGSDYRGRTYRFDMPLSASAEKSLPIAAGEQEMDITVTITYALNHGPRS